VSVQERATCIGDTLSSGRPIVAAWDMKPFKRTDRRSLEGDWCSECTSVLAYWQFTRSHHSIQMLLAPHDQNSHHDSDFSFDSTIRFSKSME
jgi:hypothetical protein